MVITDLQSAIDYIRDALRGPRPNDVKLTGVLVPHEVREKIIDDMLCGPFAGPTREGLKSWDDQAPTEVRVLGVLIKDEACTSA